tara:strand:+ start:252 stop:452 length:201 start_codon:yes stop_codon:yes gene_type:complete
MRFIMIENDNSTSIAINTNNITAIKIFSGQVCICLGGDTPVSTKFTTIEAAVDFIQRAPSVSMGVS